VFYRSVGTRADQVFSAYPREPMTEATMTNQPQKAEPTEFRRAEAAEARLARLRARPGAVQRVEKIRAEMAETDRLYAENLAAIRKARAMGAAQSEISRIESRPDMLLSNRRSGRWCGASPPDRRPGKIATWNVCLESVDTSCGPPTRWPWARGIAIA
jgi:hypothetical protein